MNIPLRGMTAVLSYYYRLLVHERCAFNFGSSETVAEYKNPSDLE